MRLPSLSGPGASLIEVVVSIGLFAVFASTLFVAMGSQLLTTVSTNQTLEALPLAREGLEAARAIRDGGWSSLATGTHGLVYTSSTWGFQGTSDVSGNYTRRITVTDTSTSTERKVVSSVSWMNASQQPRTISLETTISNWRNAYVAAATLPPLLGGDWGNPQTFGTVDLGAGITATGVAVRNKMVYMTGTAGSAGKSDFFVINALDGSNPTVAGELNIGPGSNAVVLSATGTYAYVANNDTSNQLSIINISATSSPQNILNYTLPFNDQQAISIAVTSTYIIIGTRLNSHKEVYFLNAVNPISISPQFPLEVGASVNHIAIFGNRAFLATSHVSQELIVANISNMANVVTTTAVNLPGSNPATGLFIDTRTNRIYITRSAAGGTSPEINVYDISNPDAPVFVTSSEFGSDIPTVIAADDKLFLGTSDSNLEFQIYIAATLAYSAGLNFPQVVNDMVLEDNLIYAAVRSNDGLRIISSQ